MPSPATASANSQPRLPRLRVLAVDPGRQKCGMAVLDSRDGIVARGVVPTDVVADVARRWILEHHPELLLCGRGTGSRAVIEELEQVADDAELDLELREERDTTLLARRRYFEENPPRGWRRLIPLGLQSPPIPVDDYAAVLIAEGFLAEAAGQE